LRKSKFISLLKKFIVPILIYFIGLFVLLLFIYNQKERDYLSKIDQQLLAATSTVKYALPLDFHDVITDSNSVSSKQDWENMMKLTELSKKLNVSFLYTLIVKDGIPYFTSCSTNDYELLHKTVVHYFTPYNKASKSLISIPRRKKPVFETTTDHWGTFRSALVPVYSLQGKLYIVGADMDINAVYHDLRTELYYIILIGLLLTILFMPTIIQIIRIDQRLSVFLRKKVDERTSELSKELIEHKQTEIQLRNAIREREEFAAKAKESLDSKTNLITTISHELRTPLNVIIGINTLMTQTKLNDEQRDYCLTIYDASKQILNLIEEAMHIYYSQPERINLELSAFDVNNLISQVISQFSQVIRHKKLHFNYSVDEHIPHYLIGDESFIRQVLFNLISNSVKFTEKGEINITAHFEEILLEENKVIVLFSIKDTGIGMDEEKQKAITKALHDTNILNESAELGLGLSLCKHLIKMLNSSLWFKSQPGQGTEFYFRLPLQIGTSFTNISELPLFPESSDSEIFIKKSFQILLAEDNELNIKVALKSLERLGHEISVAKNGKQVISLLKTQTFDVILMDIEMPEMNGIEAADFIQKHPEEVSHSLTPIIALTAHALPDVQRQCEQVGIKYFVVKPINFEELNDLMYKVINEKKKT
jgi:signal transduction histidine kinase/ActR/RegA family two-component response regulator